MSVSPPDGQQQANAVSPLARALSIYSFRRRRSAIFADSDIFGEPAYDILLDLYIAHQQGRSVAISDACVAADVPCSTALRYVSTLERRGFIRRFSDPDDRRRSYLVLQPLALVALDKLLT